MDQSVRDHCFARTPTPTSPWRQDGRSDGHSLAIEMVRRAVSCGRILAPGASCITGGTPSQGWGAVGRVVPAEHKA